MNLTKCFDEFGADLRCEVFEHNESLQIRIGVRGRGVFYDGLARDFTDDGFSSLLKSFNESEDYTEFEEFDECCDCGSFIEGGGE